LHLGGILRSLLLLEFRSITLRERLSRRSCSGRLLLRDRRNSCLYLVRSPWAGRINSLFGDYLGVPLRDEDSVTTSNLIQIRSARYVFHRNPRTIVAIYIT
jgi:hypothetical protein